MSKCRGCKQRGDFSPAASQSHNLRPGARFRSRRTECQMKPFVQPFGDEVITLRLVKEHDLETILAWRNRDEARVWFKTSEKLSFDSHRRWYEIILPVGMISSSSLKPMTGRLASALSTVSMRKTVLLRSVASLQRLANRARVTLPAVVLNLSTLAPRNYSWSTYIWKSWKATFAR